MQSGNTKATPNKSKAEILFNLGKHFEFTVGDLNKAANYYKQAADLNHPTATLYFGICYRDGRGVNQDTHRANTLFERAGELGDSLAEAFKIKSLEKLLPNFKISQVLEKGSQDAKQKLSEIRRGLTTAQVIENIEIDDKPDEAKSVLELAKSGNIASRMNLGYRLLHGIHGFAKDIYKATIIFEEYAKQGIADAEYYLGFCYAKGLGVAASDEKAVECYKKAANKGHIHAKYFLSIHLYDGKGVEKDKKESIRLLKEAADEGNPDAQYLVGYSHEKGVDHFSKDMKIALTWYEKAAEKGQLEAKNKCAELKKSQEKYQQQFVALNQQLYFLRSQRPIYAPTSNTSVNMVSGPQFFPLHFHFPENATPQPIQYTPLSTFGMWPTQPKSDPTSQEEDNSQAPLLYKNML